MARISDTTEDEVLPRIAMRSGVMLVTPDLGERREFGDHGISTMSDSRAHHPAAIVHRNVVGQCLSHGVPVAGREVRSKRS